MLACTKARLWPIVLCAAAAAGCSSSTNQPPIIHAVTAAPLPAQPGSTVAVAVAATDPDNDALTYEWTAPAGWSVAGAATGPAIQLTAPATAAQSAVVVVTVTDTHHHQTTGQTLVTTAGGQTPSFTTLSQPYPLVPGGTALLLAVAESATGADVTYTWTVSDAAWTITGTGGSAVLRAPLRYDATTAVTVVADDGQGQPAKGNIAVSTLTYQQPVVSGVNLTPRSLLPGEQGTATVFAASPIGLDLTYAWTAADAAWTVAGTGAAATITAPATMNAATVLTVTVTDAAQGTTQRSVVVSTAPGQGGLPAAVIAGGSTINGVMNTPLALDGSGSHSQTGDWISYRWTVLSAPAGAETDFRTPDLSASDRSAVKPMFIGNRPGAYEIQLAVTDGETGETGYAVTQVVLAGPAKIEVVSGDAQTATVGQDLPAPLVVRVLTGRDEPVPYVWLFWDLVNGTIFSGTGSPGVAYGRTDENGQSAISVRLPRIAGDGSATVTLTETASPVSTSFSFHALADRAASINLSAPTGNVIDGVTVTVRTVDQYGNPATDNATANTAGFRLKVASPSGQAKFAPAGGQSTATLDAQLTNGVYTVTLAAKRAEPAWVTLEQGPSGITALPFTAWSNDLYDDAELGLGHGVTAFVPVNLPQWDLQTGAAKVAAGSRAYGAELAPSEVRVFGATELRSQNALAAPLRMTKLTFAQKVQVAATRSDTQPCTLQPGLFVYRTNAAGTALYLKRPVGGYDVRDLCTGWVTGLESFGATTGWATHTVDLTDDANVATGDRFGFRIYNPSDSEASGTSQYTLANPVQSLTWYVDNLQVVSLGPPSDTSVATTVQFLPGPTAAVKFAATTGAYLPGPVSGLQKTVNVDARLVDANGNQTRESEMVYRITWDGAAVPLGFGFGNPPLAIDVHQADIKFQAGRATLMLQDLAVETVHLGLANPNTYAGVDVTSTAGAAVPWTPVVHTDANLRWSDTVPNNTYDVTEATRACETARVAAIPAVQGQCAVDPSFPGTVTVVWQYGQGSYDTLYFAYAAGQAQTSGDACVATASSSCTMGTACPSWAAGAVVHAPWSAAGSGAQTTCGGHSYWSGYTFTPQWSLPWN